MMPPSAARPRAIFAALLVNKAARQSGLLMGAQGIGLLLSFCFTVLITRNLEVAEYGKFRYAMTFLAMMMMVLQVGWPYSIARLLALAVDRPTQRRIVGAGLVLLGVSSVIGTVGTVLGVKAARVLGVHAPPIVVWVAPFLYIPLGQQLLTSVCQGLNRIRLLAVQQVLPYTILIPITAFQLFLVRAYSLEAALWGYVAVFTLTIVIGFSMVGVSFDDRRNWVGLIFAENRQTGFPIYVGGIFGVASAQLISLWTTEFTDALHYGQYALALAVANPLGVLISSVGTVIFRTSANERALSPRLLFGAIGLAGLIGLVYWLAMPQLLIRVFGHRYGPAAPLAQFLGLGSLMIGCGDIFQRFLSAKGLGKRLGFAAVCTGTVGMASAALLVQPMGVDGAIISAVLASATYLSLMLGLYLRRPLAAGDESVLPRASE